MSATAIAEGANRAILARRQARERQFFLKLASPAVLGIMIVVFLPILWLSSLSLFDASGDWSLANYARVFQSPLYQKTFHVTFIISIWVTALCVLLGYPLCYWLSRLSPRTSGILIVFVLVPFWTSLLVRTYAWLVLLQRKGIINQGLITSRDHRRTAAARP